MNTLKYWLLLAALVGTSYGMSIVWRNRQPSLDHSPVSTTEKVPIGSNEPLPPFTLTDQDSEPFDSASLRGQVWVASFFFTNCPGTCRQLNLALAKLQADTPESQVRYVSFTCDPQNDSPDALKTYAAFFQAEPARWTFLTGEFAELQKVAGGLQVALAKAVHSERAFVINRQGRVCGNFRILEPDDVTRMKKLIANLEEETSL